MSSLGPHSRSTFFAKLKLRSPEGQLFQSIRQDLLDHIGGNPSATQAMIIERIAWLRVHLALMDRKIAQGQLLGDFAGRQYMSWANTEARLLLQLGLKGAPAKKQTLADKLATAEPGAAAKPRAKPRQRRIVTEAAA